MKSREFLSVTTGHWSEVSGRWSVVSGQWSVVTLISLTLALTVACQQEPDDKIAALDEDTIAVINGQPIERQKFENFVRFNQGESPPEASRSQLFREFLMKQLVLQEAEREGTVVPESEVQQSLQDWLPKDQELSPSLIEDVRDFLKSQKFVAERIRSRVDISLDELQDYYQDHQQEFIAGDGAHVLEILVEQPALAARIRREIRPGDIRTFKRAARDHSQGSSAERGGDLGIFKRGELPEEFEKVIFVLKPGELSSVLHSSQGYHIFMMEEFVRRHPQKFYEVQGAIFNKLTVKKERAALDNYLNEILQHASIRVYDEMLDSTWRDTHDSQNQ